MERTANRRPVRLRTVLLALLTVATGSAWAHGANVECKEPKEEWRPQMELQRKLTSEGWNVRRVKTDQGCYEVYGFDAKGKRAEVYFNPKTFEKVAEVEHKDD